MINQYRFDTTSEKIVHSKEQIKKLKNVPMNYKEHAKAGIIAATATSGLWVGLYMYYGNLPSSKEVIAIFFGVLFGSLSPDLDTQSTPSKIVALFGSAFCLFSIIYREPYPALIFSAGFLFIKSLNHRTWTHVWTLPLILAWVALKFQHIWLLAFANGIVIHYILDCFGKQTMNPLKWDNWIKPIKIKLL